MRTTLTFTVELTRELTAEEIDELGCTLVAQCEDVGFIIGSDKIDMQETYKPLGTEDVK